MDMKPKTLLRRVLDFARTEIERRARPVLAPQDPSEHGSAQSQIEELRPVSSEPMHKPTKTLDVAPDETGRLRVHWALGEEDIARARKLINGDAVLCLRLVSFAGTRDDVKRDVMDRPFVPTSGSCELASVDMRGVVALGLRAGERFVSIVHHIV